MAYMIPQQAVKFLDKFSTVRYDKGIGKGFEKEEYIRGAIREDIPPAERIFGRVRVEGSF